MYISLVMKKLVLSLVLLVLCVSWTNAQDSWTAADGTAYHLNVPLDFYRTDTNTLHHAQMLYPANLLTDMVGQSIYKLTFYHKSTSTKELSDGNFTVSVGTTDLTELTGFDQSTALTTVFNGTLKFVAGVAELELSQPFIYNGGNLLIDFSCYQIGWISPSKSGFYGVNNVGSTYSNMSSPNATSFVPKVTFTKTPSCIKPTLSQTVTTTPYSATISWTPSGTGQTLFDIYYSTTNTAPTAETTPSASNISGTSYQLTGLSPVTQYYVWIRGNCGTTTNPDISGGWTAPVSFTTEIDAITTFPWSEDFESYNPNIVPPYWDNSASTSSTYSVDPEFFWGVCITLQHPVKRMIRMYNHFISRGSAVINTPKFALPSEAVYQLAFDYSHRASCGAFKVNISDDNGATFTELGSYTVTNSYSHSDPDTFTRATIDLNDYVGKIIILQFFAISDAGEGAIFIDNMSIDLAPSCLRPTRLDTNNVTPTSAELSWKANSGETAWTVYYKKDTADNYSGVSVATNPYTLSGLEANTNYQYYVVANCSAEDTSAPSAVFTFTTPCEIINTFPWSEDFNSYMDSTGSFQPTGYPDLLLPECWQFLNRSAYANLLPQVFISSYDGYPVSGNCLFFKSSTTIPLYAILPDFEEEIAGLRLTFTYRNERLNTSTLTVGYITDPTDASTFTGVLTCNQITTLTEMEVFFPDAPAGSRIAFLYYQGGLYSTYYLSIDNISVDYVPVCLQPMYLKVVESSVNAESAMLTWKGFQNAYEVQYRPISDSIAAEWQSISITNDTIQLTGLTSETTYEWRVRGLNCDGEDSTTLWSSTESFTTPPTPKVYQIVNTVSDTVTQMTWEQFVSHVSDGDFIEIDTIYLMEDISVSTMAGTSSIPFVSTFDGRGHTITVNYTATGSDYTALFRRIDSATIKNLSVTGTINMGGYQFGGGIAGDCYGTNTFTNCLSNVTINSSVNGDGTHGGFIARNQGGNTTFNGCAFTGKLLGVNTTNCGGFCGWTEHVVTFNDCVFAPEEVSENFLHDNGSRSFTRRYNASLEVVHNSYYTQCMGSSNVEWQRATVTGGEGITVTLAGESTAFDLSEIQAYSKGLLYKDTIYVGAVETVNLTLSGSDYYGADYGTLTQNGDHYTLEMDSHNAVISVSCPLPDNLQVSDVTFYGAQVSWTGPSISYNIRYRAVASSEWQTATVDTAGIGLTGLAPETEYEVQVQGVCDVVSSAWREFTNFTTQCAPFNVFPWVENFDSLTAGIPHCWDNSEGTITDDSYKWNYTSSGHSGAGVMFNLMDNALGKTNYLKTPPMDLPADATMRLNFWYMNSLVSNDGHRQDFRVYISTDGGKTYNTALTPNLDQTTWTKMEILLDDYVGAENVVFVFEGVSVQVGDAYIYLDDIEVKEYVTVTADKIVDTVNDPATEMTWDQFAAYLNDDAHFTHNSFTLMDDISVSTMLGSAENPFSGTFDGNDHTITVNYIADDQYAAPFRYVNAVTIQNLKVDGVINMGGHKFGAGLVGRSHGDNTFTNCVSDVTINASINGDGSHGGFLAFNHEGTNTFSGCAFTGKLLGSNTNQIGGFCGWNEYKDQQYGLMNFYNCLFAPEEVTMGSTGSATFSRSRDLTKVYLSNSFYTQSFGTDQGRKAYTVTADGPVTVTMEGVSTTSYNVSDIDVYSTGIVFKDTILAGQDETLSLQLGGSASGAYKTNYGTLTGAENPYSLTMDAHNIVIMETCLTPTNLAAVPVYNSAELSWTPGLSESAWTIHYKKSSDNEYTSVVATTNPYTLQDLEYNVQYDYYVVANCSEINEGNPSAVFSFILPIATTLIVDTVNNPATEMTWSQFVSYVSEGLLSFSDTIKLMDDISVTTMVGDESHPFRGVFDGNGHTITVNYTARDNNFTAPFRHINAATFLNLKVDGNINMANYKFGAGLVGECYGDNTYINCVSDVTINSSMVGDCTHGGFIAINHDGTNIFRGCAFTGKMQSVFGENCGGFCGWNEYRDQSHGLMNFYDCVFAPERVTISPTGSATFSRSRDLSKVFLSNCYYTRPFGTVQGEQAYSVTAVSPVVMEVVGSPVTTYNVSGIDVYSVGIVYNDIFYASEGDVVTLSLSGSPTGIYESDHSTLSQDGANYSLAMAAYNTVISAYCSLPSDFEVEDIADNSAQLSWTGSNDSYDIHYRPVPRPEDYVLSEDFSGDISDWTLLQNIGITGAQNGRFVFRYSYNPQYLISPEISDLTQNAFLEFAYWNNTFTFEETFRVGFSSTTTDLSSFTWGEIIAVRDESRHVYNSVVPAGTKYMAIQYVPHDTLEFYLYIDDISIIQDEWQTINVDTVGIELTGLISSTEYEVQIRGLCDTVPSAWSGLSNFTTLCTLIDDFPWVENFNSLTAGIPECWDNSVGTTTEENYKWNYTSSGHSGAGLRFDSKDNPFLKTNYLKTPPMDFPAGATMQLSFWYKNPLGALTTARPEFRVYISTDGGATYNTALTPVLRQTSWTKQEILLTNYVGAENVVIVFGGVSNANGVGDSYIYLDDIEVKEYVVVTADKIVDTVSDPATEMTWDQFAGYVNNNANFTHTSFTLMDDISVTTMVGTVENPFSGTFDGNGHTITVNYTADAQYAAPFRYVNAVTIQNLKVDGEINMGGHKFGAGIVGGSHGDNTFTNCVSDVTITASINGDGTHGGFIAINHDGANTFRGCAFTGRLLGSSTNQIGGFCGWNEYRDQQYGLMKFYDCLFAPKEVTMDTTGSATFSRSRDLSKVFVSNSYYTQSFGTVQGTQAYTVIGVNPVTVAMDGTPTTSYNVSGIDVYSTGIVFKDTIYAGNGDMLGLNLSGIVSGFYEVDHGTLAQDGDNYTLTMDASNTEISLLCPTPSALQVSDITPIGATATWTGNSDSYTMRYREVMIPMNYIYDFETCTKEGWTGWDLGGTENNSHQGLYYLCSPWHSPQETADVKDWLISPQISLGGTLSFYIRRLNYNYDDRFQVYVSTTGNNISDFTAISEVISPSSTYGLYEFDLSNYSGDGYVAIVHVSAGGQAYVYVDDINITASVGGEYGEWQTVSNAVSPQEFSNLTPEATYQVKVNGSCSGVESEYSNMVEFTTPELCSVPTNLEVSNLTHDTVQLGWTENGFASSWTVQWSILSDFVDGSYSEVTVSDTSSTMLTGLIPNATYFARVKANCGIVHAESPWSDMIDFTVPNGYSVCEDFEAYTGTAQNVSGVVPDGWSVIFTGSEGRYSPHVATGIYDETIGYDGTPSAFDEGSVIASGNGFCFNAGASTIDGSYNQYGKDNYVILPGYEGHPDSITFKYRYESEGNGLLTLGYVTNASDASTFVTLHDVPVSIVQGTQITYALLTVDIPSGARLAFRWSNANFRHSCGIDDVCVSYVSSVCPPVTGVTFSDITSHSAQVNWTGTTDTCNIRYRATESFIKATIIFSPADIWEEGLGYQMLLDADANTYGSIIPTTGSLTQNCDTVVSYDDFEYKLPSDAEGTCSTYTFLIGSSDTIQIVPGIYDWVMTIPIYDSYIRIASSGGNVGGRQNDYLFEGGKTYHFAVSADFEAWDDQVDVTITPNGADYILESDWIVVEGVSGPYTISNLESEQRYEVQVQPVCGDEEWGEWSPIESFTTTPAPMVYQIVNTVSDTATQMTWNQFVNHVSNGDFAEIDSIFLMEDISVTTMAGTESHPFTSIFDGNGHTLNVSYSGSDQGAAPFRYISGATIMNLIVDGSITTSAHHAGGLVGFADNTSPDVTATIPGVVNTIVNCHVSVDVTSSSGKYIGGIVGHAKSVITNIIGCVYDGTLSSSGYKGGMFGWADWATLNITNSFFNGTNTGNGHFDPVACKTHIYQDQTDETTLSVSLSNCYYNTDGDFGSDDIHCGMHNAILSGSGKHAYSVTGTGGVTVAMAGAPTVYDVSGIQAYSTGIVYSGTIIAGVDDAVNLNLAGGSAYTTDHGTLTGTTNPYVLSMEAYNTVISATAPAIIVKGVTRTGQTGTAGQGVPFVNRNGQIVPTPALSPNGEILDEQ